MARHVKCKYRYSRASSFSQDMVIPELCAWGLCLWFKSFLFFFSPGPPLLISRLITGSQLLQAAAEKRKFLSCSQISQICITFLVWKKFRCKQRCWAYKCWSVSIDEGYSIAGTWESFAAKPNKCSQNESVPCAPVPSLLSHPALAKEPHPQHQPQRTGHTGEAPPSVMPACDQWCPQLYGMVGVSSCLGVPPAVPHGVSCWAGIPACCGVAPVLCHSTSRLPCSLYLVFLQMVLGEAMGGYLG